MPTLQNPIMSSGTILTPPTQGNNPPVGATDWSPSSGMAGAPSGMIMQPTILSPGMPRSPGIDLYGGIAQPFTPFVNGIPWQPSTPSINPSVSDHPCQGKGGSGGRESNCHNAKNNNNESVGYSPSISENFPIQKDYTRIRFDHSNGLSFIASAQRSSNDRIDFTLVDVLNNVQIANFSLLRDLKRNGWVKNTQNILETSMVIPMEVTLNDLCLGFWCAHMVGEIYKSKIETGSPTQSSDNPFGSNSFTPTLQSNGSDGLPCEGKLCVTHDLKCSLPITDFVTFYLLWCPGVQVNLHDCCVQHDIHQWCGASSWIDRAGKSWAYAAELMTCMYTKIIKELNEQVPWWCGGFVTANTLGAVLAFIFVLGVFLVVGFAGMFISEKYFPTDDRNKKSCLCDGLEPTVWCDNCKRDLCKEFGSQYGNLYGKCFNCYWRCLYDSEGNPILDKRGKQKKELVTDPSGKLHCCDPHPPDRPCIE